MNIKNEISVWGDGQEKRDLLKEVKEKHDKVAAMQKEMESKSKVE